MIWFPDTGLPAGEYYAGLQAACDAGEHPELLTPAGAAAAFIRDYFGTEPAEENLRPLDAEAEAWAMADLRLRELVAEVCAGKDVDGVALLACLGRVGEDNWASLGMLEPVGLEGDWWPALLAALEGAAVGGDQPARDRDMMVPSRSRTAMGNGSTPPAISPYPTRSASSSARGRISAASPAPRSSRRRSFHSAAPKPLTTRPPRAARPPGSAAARRPAPAPRSGGW